MSPGSSWTVLGDRELTEVQTGVLVRTAAVIKHPGWEFEGQKLLSRGSGGSLLAMCSCGKESNESLPLLIRLPVLQGWGLVTSFSLNYLLKGPTSKHRASTWESGGHHSVHGSTHFIHFLQRLVIYIGHQTLLGGEMMGVSMRPLPQTSLTLGDAASMQELDRKEAVKGAAQKYQPLLGGGEVREDFSEEVAGKQERGSPTGAASPPGAEHLHSCGAEHMVVRS